MRQKYSTEPPKTQEKLALCQGYLKSFFDLQNPQFFAFCKTGRQPYDLLVISALVRFAHYFPDARLVSDGGNEAINEGVKLCQGLFGEMKKNASTSPLDSFR